MSWQIEVVAGVDSGKKTRFANGVVIIGRDVKQCNLILNDNQVSRLHARVKLYDDDTVSIEDLGSTNGTLINNEPIYSLLMIGPQDTIRVGDTTISLVWTADNNMSIDYIGGQVEAASHGQLFNLNHVLQMPFHRRNILKWLLGSLLTFIPILSFLADGYRYRLYQSGQQGIMEMPEWENWGELFVKGLLFFLIASLYFLVPALYATFAVTAALRSPGLTVGLLFAAAIPAILLNLGAGFILPMSWAHYAASGKFVDAFNLSSIIQGIREVLGEYVKLYLVIIILGLIIAILYTIPILGILLGLLGTFYIYIIASLLFGQLSHRSLNKAEVNKQVAN